ncbi:MAG TPA: phosphohistidine phosphatase SixA [Verrucomicrobiae bacterium]|jgi:phosphohistidine phosphatase|nr:phosphohistidine phosphatase SixA [Verrucomicrobiae bacterium]
MELYLLRHGIAEDRNPEAPNDDSLRRLTAEGRTKMRRATGGMKSLELEFDLILASPYLRTKETAKIVAEGLGCEELMEVSGALASEGGNPRVLIEELKRDYGECESLLVVGHEPYLSRLIGRLISGDDRSLVTMKKGALCKLAVGDLSYGRCACLEWLLTSSQLRQAG